ncbi:hypothetical protein ABZP36_034597 [Zizania latifolia]
MEASSAASPDLSLQLHISLPSSAPPPGSGGAGGGDGRGAVGGGDPWRRLDGSTASTELSLSPPQAQQQGQEQQAGGGGGGVDPLPWRHRPSAVATTSGAGAEMMATTPMMLRPLDASCVGGGGASSAQPPIRGIPIYNGPGGFPFLQPTAVGDGGHHHYPKVGFYSSYNHPPTWPSSLGSTSPSPLAPGPPPPAASLDPTAAFLSPAAHYRMLSASNRLNLNGMLSDTLRGYGASGGVGGLGAHHHLHGAQPFGLSSRFLPKLPAKRSMRAPRMRWTNTLHARFVHAVELLGGHESTSSSSSPAAGRRQPIPDQNLVFYRGDAQVGARAHGREGSDASACQEPPPGPADGGGSGDEDFPGSGPTASGGGDSMCLQRAPFAEHGRSASEGAASSVGGGDMDQSSAGNTSTTRWSNSSRDPWLSSNSCNMDAHRSNLEPCRSSSSQVSNHELSSPSLEFTLGRPDWHGADHD